MSLVTNLKALLIKMGGTPADYDTANDLVGKISAAYDATAQLPAVTAEDKGKYAHVNDESGELEYVNLPE